MRGFKYYTPTEIKFGKEAEMQAGAMLKKYGAKKVFVHYGSERIVKSGLLGKILGTLDKEGIESRPLWKPMHKQPVYAKVPKYVNGVSENLFHKGLCLPSGPCVTDEDVDRIIQTIKATIL